MRRRTFLASTLLSVNLPKIVFAQAPARVFRVGWIGTPSAASSALFVQALRAGLADLDYIERRNLVIEARYADDVLSRIPTLAKELLQIPVDIIVTQGPATWDVLNATTT